MKKWIFRGLSSVLLLTFFYFLFACGKKKVETKLVAVTRGDIQEKALAVGTIEPEKEIKVKSTIPGIVSEVLFKVGDAVKDGAPLFKISPNPTPLEYVEARRSMELAEVTMQKLKADWDRQLELFQGKLISQPRWTRPRAPTRRPTCATRPPRSGSSSWKRGGSGCPTGTSIPSSGPRSPASSCPKASSRGTRSSR